MNSKNIRLIFGLIFLFSVFLFMGTQPEEGCLGCDDGKKASITVYNASPSKQKVYIAGPSTEDFYLGVGTSAIKTVSPGSYVVTTRAAPFYNSNYYSVTIILIEGAKKSVTIP